MESSVAFNRRSESLRRLGAAYEPQAIERCRFKEETPLGHFALQQRRYGERKLIFFLANIVDAPTWFCRLTFLGVKIILFLFVCEQFRSTSKKCLIAFVLINRQALKRNREFFNRISVESRVELLCV